MLQPQDLLALVGSVLLSLGGGAAIVWALARWLGQITAERILERERVVLSRETDLLMRRRDVYSRLAKSLRIHTSGSTTPERKAHFLECYDEASVWAPDSVMNAVGNLLDLVAKNSAAPGSVSQADLKAAYCACIDAMRADSGFPNSTFRFRFVSF